MRKRRKASLFLLKTLDGFIKKEYTENSNHMILGGYSMKTSIQTGKLCDILGIDAGMAIIKSAGFEAIDFGGLDSTYPWQDAQEEKPYAFFEDEEKMWALVNEYKAAAEKYGITFGQFHAPTSTYYPRKPKATENMHNAIRKSIEVCGYCNCPYIVVHPCFDGSARFPTLTKEEEYKLNIEFYSSLIPALKKHNVICCLENMWSQDWRTKKIYSASCSDPNEACRYIDTLNEIAGEKRFAFCFDVGHYLLLGLDPCNVMEILGDRIVALHTHDNGGIDDDHTLPYLGCCNWDRFVKGLRKIGYKGTLNYETAGFNSKFPAELIPAAVHMLGATASYLRDRVVAEEKK